jgi:hypothetical protein
LAIPELFAEKKPFGVARALVARPQALRVDESAAASEGTEETG